jgi:hypothetical protein
MTCLDVFNLRVCNFLRPNVCFFLLAFDSFRRVCNVYCKYVNIWPDYNFMTNTPSVFLFSRSFHSDAFVIIIAITWIYDKITIFSPTQRLFCSFGVRFIPTRLYFLLQLREYMTRLQFFHKHNVCFVLLAFDSFRRVCIFYCKYVNIWQDFIFWTNRTYVFPFSRSCHTHAFAIFMTMRGNMTRCHFLAKHNICYLLCACKYNTRVRYFFREHANLWQFCLFLHI